MLRLRNLLCKINKSYNNERGSTLLTVLIIMLIFAVIGSAVLITTTNNLYVSQRMSEYEDTYYMAEANAQYALTFVKEEVTKLYMDMQKITADRKWEYNKAMEDFYPSIVEKLSKNPNNVNANQFIPLDFSDQGVTTTVNITNSTLPSSGFGEEGNAVRFMIESIAESDTSRRVVNAVLVIDDPDVDWDMTSAPPMTDMRMLIGDEIILTDDWNAGEYNSIFCRGSALIAHYFVPQFLADHSEFLNTYTYDYSNAVPEMLKWDLQYDKFPTHKAYDEFGSMFDASSSGNVTYDSFFDWRSRTVNYNIPNPAPLTYANKDIIDSSSKEKDVDFYYTQSTQQDTRYSTRYEGTVDDPVRVYASGNLVLTGTKNLKNCYIYAEGYVKIDINGYIENTIIISNQSYVNIDCKKINNTTNNHYLIKAKYDLDLEVNIGATIKQIVGVSEYGSITVDHGSYATKKKITLYNCYLYTNKGDRDAMIYLKNIYANKSFFNAGKDLVLRNCSGLDSGYYAHGYTDDDIDDYGTYYMYLGNYYSYKYLDYNRYMQYRVDRSYFRRYMRGILFISELPELANRQYKYENTFNNCDFTTDQSIFLCDPRYETSYGTQIVDLNNCRLMADREVLIEDVIMTTCYTYAGIRGYEEEQDYYNYYGTPKLYAVRGIYMRMDHTHNHIENCVFYSRGRMMYSQHTPEGYGYPISEHGKVRVYSSFFYSIKNFEYNGTSTSQGLDTAVMRNNSDLCNNMIIMTEENLGPHEFSPSVANDVVFIGGDLGLDPDRPHYSATLESLIGEEKIGEYGVDGSIDVQCHILYENYFEQLLSLDEIQRNAPTFGDVFIFEDIYEKKEAEMEDE